MRNNARPRAAALHTNNPNANNDKASRRFRVGSLRECADNFGGDMQEEDGCDEGEGEDENNEWVYSQPWGIICVQLQHRV